MTFLLQRFFTFSWRTAGLGLTLLFFLLVVVRLSVKDHFAVACAIYYGSPPLLLSVLSAAVLAYWLSRKKKSMVVVMSAATVLCIIWSYRSCYVSNPQACDLIERPSADRVTNLAATPAGAKASTAAGTQSPCGAEKPAIRLLFWNTCRGQLGWKGVISKIHGYDPDIIAVVESGYRNASQWFWWHKTFSEYSMGLGRYGMNIVCRGRILGLKQHLLTHNSCYQLAELDVRGQRFVLVLVDLGSAPLRSRAGRIASLVQLAQSLNDQPLIMAGDFNLPHDSVHFRQFDGLLQNAFRTVGNGYAPSWPVPLPLIQIDHVWTNRHIELCGCTTGWSRHSDHRPIIVDFRLAPANAAGKEMNSPDFRPAALVSIKGNAQ